MKKKSIIILCSVAAVCAIGLVTSHFVDWPVNSNDTSGDIAKAARFSREQASEKLTNMEELLKTDSAFKDGIVAAQVVMQTRAAQFGTLVDLSNEVAGNIPAFAEVLKEMNANREMVNNVTNSLVESADNLNAALPSMPHWLTPLFRNRTSWLTNSSRSPTSIWRQLRVMIS